MPSAAVNPNINLQLRMVGTFIWQDFWVYRSSPHCQNAATIGPTANYLWVDVKEAQTGASANAENGGRTTSCHRFGFFHPFSSMLPGLAKRLVTEVYPNTFELKGITTQLITSSLWQHLDLFEHRYPKHPMHSNLIFSIGWWESIDIHYILVEIC